MQDQRLIQRMVVPGNLLGQLPLLPLFHHPSLFHCNVLILLRQGSSRYSVQRSCDAIVGAHIGCATARRECLGAAAKLQQRADVHDSAQETYRSHPSLRVGRKKKSTNRTPPSETAINRTCTTLRAQQKTNQQHHSP
eukprot:2379904-Rhodomonas_salina.2